MVNGTQYFATNGTSQMQIALDGTITGTKGNVQLISGTAQATTSGTSVTFTGIPSWAKRITVIFNGVSTNGTSNYQIQVGSGSVTTTGYTCGSYDGATGLTATTGFLIRSSNASFTFCGLAILTNVSSNTWTASTNLIRTNDGGMSLSSGNISLGGTLDRVVITTVNGTDTFDAGSINILYE